MVHIIFNSAYFLFSYSLLILSLFRQDTWSFNSQYYLKFKSRDITLPTKVRLVKPMVFPVVMYGCESWTVKKAERMRLFSFHLTG